jgi:hypothetical protein
MASITGGDLSQERINRRGISRRIVDLRVAAR